MDGLDAKQAAKVLWTLSAIKLTHPAPSVYLKKMVATDDLWEVRVIFAGNIFRLPGWMEGMDELVPPRAPSDAQVPWAYSGIIR